MEERGEDAARPLQRKHEIIPYAVLGVDAGRLEFPADAQPVDLVLIQLGEVMARGRRGAEFDFAAIGLGAAADEIEESRFAGAIRPDHRAQFAFEQIEREIRNGLEAIVGLRDVFDAENRMWHGRKG